MNNYEILIIGLTILIGFISFCFSISTLIETRKIVTKTHNQKKGVKEKLEEYKLAGLKSLANRLGNSGYSKLKYGELIIFIIKNNTKDIIEKELGISKRRRTLKLTAAIITVPIALLSFYYILLPKITAQLYPEKITKIEPGNQIFADTFEIVPFPDLSLKAPKEERQDSLIYDGIEVLEEERFYDFRRSNWIENSSKNILKSPVCLKRKIQINKDSSCQKITFRFSCSGGISARCNNYPYTFSTPNKAIPNNFNNHIMTSIDIIIDLKKYQKDTMLTFDLEATYYNGFQNRNKEWIGSSNLGTSLPKKSSLKAYFTEERRPQKFYTCGYIAYDTTCHKIPRISILSSTDSLVYSWILFTNEKHTILDGIDSVWEWKK